MADQPSLETLRHAIDRLRVESGASDADIAEAVATILRRQTVIDPFRETPEHAETLWHLTWWMFIRASALDLRQFIYSSMALDVIQDGTRSLEETIDDLEELESSFGLDSPAPLPVDNPEARQIRKAFQRSARLSEPLDELEVDDLEDRVTEAVTELLKREELFRELSSAIAEDLMVEFDDLAQDGEFDDAMHGSLIEPDEEADASGRHQHDYDELDRSEDYVERADERYEQGDVDGAVEDYTRALDLDPDHPSEIYHRRGVAKAAMEETQGAIEDFSEALEIDADNVGALVDRGLAYYDQDNPQKALEDYNRAADTTDDDTTLAKIYANRGVARFMMGQRQDAMEDFERALELDSASPAPYLNRAKVRRANRDLEGALEDYDRAIEVDSECADAYAARGFLKLQREQPEEAIDDLTEALELHPYDAMNYYNRGNAHAMMENYQEAIEDYDEAIELDPDDAQAYTNRGSAKMKLEDFNGAIDDWDRAIDIDPYDPSPYAKRGALWNMLDQEDEAIEDLNRALEVAPDNWPLEQRVRHMLQEIQIG